MSTALSRMFFSSLTFTRPVIIHKKLHCSIVYELNFLSNLKGIFLQKMPRQDHDIFFALTQGRQVQGHYSGILS